MQKTVKSRNHVLVLFNPKIGPLSGATTPGQSGAGSDGNEKVLHISQSSSITGISPSDCLESYPSAEKWSVYSTASADEAAVSLCYLLYVGPYALSLTFLHFGLFVWIPPLFTLRMVLGTLQGGQMLIPLMRFLLQSLILRHFLIFLNYSFLIFSFISTCLMVSASNIPKFL